MQKRPGMFRTPGQAILYLLLLLGGVFLLASLILIGVVGLVLSTTPLQAQEGSCTAFAAEGEPHEYTDRLKMCTAFEAGQEQVLSRIREYSLQLDSTARAEEGRTVTCLHGSTQYPHGDADPNCLVARSFFAGQRTNLRGWEASKHGEARPLAVFPSGGFYDPEAACLEYVDVLNAAERELDSSRRFNCRRR